MKKLFLLCLLSITVVSCEDTISNSDKENPELSAFPWVYLLTNLPPIDIDIEFGERLLVIVDGKPVPSECYNGGLCELNISVGSTYSQDSNIQTTVGTIGYESDVLFMRVESSDISNENIPYLNGTHINLNQGLELSSEICDELGLSVPYTIAAGDYEIATLDGQVFVKLN
jgi:hypothetical protein